MINPDNNKSARVAVIGAGMAGLSCATYLQSLGFEVDVFEKSWGAGGRMSTRHGDGWVADHGAQYFTARDARFIQAVETWMQHQVVTLWNPRIKVFDNNQWRDSTSKEKRYIGMPNMNSLGKYLAESLSVQFEKTISMIKPQQSGWILHSNETGKVEKTYDWIILAVQANQAQKLAKDINCEIEKITASANMKACWTMIVRFQSQPKVDLDAAFINQEKISWICRNNAKPGREGLESWTIHANPEWSQQNIELTEDEAAAHMLSSLTKLGFDCSHTQITMHRWRYASGEMSAPAGFYFSSELKLGLVGDWLHGGRVEGAWLSGYELAAKLNEFVYPS
jgi:predicted NAD/FAD-dependent oxidoreductase